MKDLNFWITFIPTFLIVITNVLQIIVLRRQLRNIREEFEGTKVIIKDTIDLRNTIMHKIEGLWSIVGSFTIFQNEDEIHNSEGFLFLTWIPGKNNYDAIYSYSVSKSGVEGFIVTAVCQGHSNGDFQHCKNQNIQLNLRVLSRTALIRHSNYSKTFTLTLNVCHNKNDSQIKKMTSLFETPSTKGTINFIKIN